MAAWSFHGAFRSTERAKPKDSSVSPTSSRHWRSVSADARIINPPQSVIVGIHATKDRQRVENGQIVIRLTNCLALSRDHRVIDGHEAVPGLVAIKEGMGQGSRMNVHVIPRS
jgi:pyruvate/2-oxoglutarate dehydrogenase complex dihydrolipoamide acyltransferase (E2) component